MKKLFLFICMAFISFIQEGISQTYHCDSLKTYQYWPEIGNYKYLSYKPVEIDYQFNEDRSKFFIISSNKTIQSSFKVYDLKTDGNNFLNFDAYDEKTGAAAKFQISCCWIKITTGDNMFFMHIKPKE